MIIDVTEKMERARRREYGLSKRIQAQNPGYNYNTLQNRNAMLL